MKINVSAAVNASFTESIVSSLIKPRPSEDVFSSTIRPIRPAARRKDAGKKCLLLIVAPAKNKI
jgi:hypothetical protein